MRPPASKDPAIVGQYDYDPLLDYCEDYAWDPSDTDLEPGDHNGYWDLSDMDNGSSISPPSQVYNTTTSRDTTLKDTPPVTFPKKIRSESLIGQTFRDRENITSKPSKISPEEHKVPHVELDVGIFEAKETHGTNKEGNSYSSALFGSLVYLLLLKYYNVTKKELRLAILKLMKWVFFKWLFVVLNLVIEVFQATFTQENAQGKISTSLYLKLSITTSFFCLMISIIETIHEGKASKVVWRSKHGCFGWFYHPGRQRRLFGRFSLILGVVSSMVQLCINLVALVINKDYLKFDTLPLLLSSGYLVAAVIDGGRKKITKSKRKVRERCPRECFWCKRLANESVRSSSFRLDSDLSYRVDESYGSVSNQFKSYSSLLSIKIQ